MSSNIATEVRRISDARVRLKSIIDRQAQQQAAQLSPDDLKLQTNVTAAQSTKVYTDDFSTDGLGGQTISSLQCPQAPIEPDFDTLKVWMPLTNSGKQSDLAGLGHYGRTRGRSLMVAGPPNCDNKMLGGSTNRVLFFDGYTSYIDIPNSTDIQMPASGGFSFCARINIREYTTQIDSPNYRRTIVNKVDGYNNAWELILSPTNGDLLFHVDKAGVQSKVKSTGVSLNTWYDIVCTYTISGNVATIYRDNVASTTADTGLPQFGYPSDNDMHIGRANYFIIPGNEYGLGGSFDSFAFDSEAFDADDYLSSSTPLPAFDPLAFDPEAFDTVGGHIDPVENIPHSVIYGGFRGAIADVRFYNFPLSSAQVGYLYTNKFSISNIPYGAAGTAGYCLSHP